MKRGIAMLLIVALAYCLAWLPACTSAAWKTLDGVQKAKALTAQQLAMAARAKHAECKTKHGVKNEAFERCIKYHRKALSDWQKIYRPTINSAVQVTVTSLQIAEKAGSDDAEWFDLLKPAACALFRVVSAWGHWFPDKGKAVLSALKMFEVFVCR